MINNPFEYLSSDKTNWYLDIPRIIANKSTKLWLGKGLLFQSKDKDLLDFANDRNIKDKWFEKLYKFGIQNSLLGKAFLMWLLNEDGNLSLTIPQPSFMDRVAKYNEQEQSAELFFQNEQSDSAKLTWVTMQNRKVKVDVFSGSKEIILGSTKTKIKPNIRPVASYELKNPFGYLPIVEITNLPQINLYGNSTQLNAYPDCMPVWDLIWDINHIIKQKRKERVVNLTRFYGALSNEKLLDLMTGNSDISEYVNDVFISVASSNYDKTGNSGLNVVQGNPQFSEYWKDYNGTMKQIYNGAGYDYNDFENSQYENKTKSLFNNKFDMETTETKIAFYSSYFYRMFDILFTYCKKENGQPYWDGKGERPYSFKFIPIAMTDQIVQDTLINSRLNNGTMSVSEAIGEYDNVDQLIAESKLKIIIKESQEVNKQLGDVDNGDNEQQYTNKTNADES